MGSQGASVFAALCCSLLLLTTPAAALAQPDAAGSPAGASPAYQPDGSDACFPDSGSEFTIGTLGPQIEMVVHLSLLTNLGAPGTLGVELSGAIDEGDPLIDLKTGAVFHGVTDVERFLANPFGVFSIAFDYTFQLPFAGIDYRSDEAPVSGPIGEARC